MKFSFERYRGTSAKLLHDRVKSVDIVDPHRVRFVLHTPWPDFLVFYATPATGAAWIVPKKYIDKVGEDGFKRQPVGLGPYRFVRMDPGLELVLEANEQYWRKKPSVKRIVIKGVPDRTTRLAMLKTGEADIGYLMVGVEAATIKADPKLRLAQVIPSATWWVEFPEQWKPKSPWHDRRVRLAANLAIDKQGINEAERLGFSRLTGIDHPEHHGLRPAHRAVSLRPRARQAPPRRGRLSQRLRRRRPDPASPVHHHGRGHRQLAWPGWASARACARWSGRPSSTPGGRRSCRGSSSTPRRLRATPPPVSRPSWSAGSAYAYGGYPDIDDLFRQQAQERDRKKREALLHQIQRLIHERVMHAPIFEPATLHGVGPRVEEPAIGLNSLLYMAAPYEEMRLKKR